jgi:hypothetical protein
MSHILWANKNGIVTSKSFPYHQTALLGHGNVACVKMSATGTVGPTCKYSNDGQCIMTVNARDDHIWTASSPYCQTKSLAKAYCMEIFLSTWGHNTRKYLIKPSRTQPGEVTQSPQLVAEVGVALPHHTHNQEQDPWSFALNNSSSPVTEFTDGPVIFDSTYGASSSSSSFPIEQSDDEKQAELQERQQMIDDIVKATREYWNKTNIKDLRFVYPFILSGHRDPNKTLPSNHFK